MNETLASTASLGEAILAHEPVIRLAVSVFLFIAIAAWEAAAPRRQRLLGRWRRWPGNLGIMALNTILLRILFPAAAVGFAAFCQAQGWGFLNAPGVSAPLAGPLAIALSVLVLDLGIYFQHVLFHAAPSLWRLHRMHHADPDFDITTGSRFHPVEIILSMGIKLTLIAAFGPPAIAVLIFEILLNGVSMFNHANLKLPAGADRFMRRFVVTPDMHRVHHSVMPSETNSNFGFCLPWWDHIFGTYKAAPALGHEAMTLGIGQFGSARDQRLDRLLLQPFIGPAGVYPFGQREKN